MLSLCRLAGPITSRLGVLAVLGLLCGPALAAAPPIHTVRRVADNSAPISFYVVKGAPGACGPDCDSWVAAEGKIDGAAAARFGKFMKQIGGRRLPIYFNSPGGNLEQALAIGNLLREKKAMARVGRTVARECGFEAQDSDVCVKLKQSGRELHGELWTRGAMCNSACPFLILGAPTREVAPDTLLAVHSPRVTLNFTGGVPTREMRSQAMQQAMVRSDHLVLDYLKKMGADPGLLTAARSVPFEGMHILTREEIAAFGIDRRQQIEMPWAFESFSRGVAYKTIIARNAGETSFRTTRFQLYCLDTNRFEFDFQRAEPASPAMTSVTMAVGFEQVRFFSPPRRAAGQETWAARMTGAQVQKLASDLNATLTETDMSGSRLQSRKELFFRDGLQAALESLTATCPPPKPAAVMAPLATSSVWPPVLASPVLASPALPPVPASPVP